MKILVTGGAGFIGSHVADALIYDGCEVHVIDDLSTGFECNIPAEAVFHRLDIRSDAAADLFAREGFDALVHHAAQMDVRKSVADPCFDADVNVLGFLNLLEAGSKHGLRRVIFASTGGAIYGEPIAGPQTEDDPLLPVSPYGISKLAAEKYLAFYAAQYGIASVALRYANVYGPRQNPHGEAGVVAIFAQSLLAGKQPVIHGDGLQTRDYIFVRDVARLNVAAIRYAGSFEAVNAGTRRETDVVTLFRLLKTLTGSDARELHGRAQQGEQRRSVLCAEKAERLFGWCAEVSFEDGLRETVRWFAKRT